MFFIIGGSSGAVYTMDQEPWPWNSKICDWRVKLNALGPIWLYTALTKGEWPLTLRSPKTTKICHLDNVPWSNGFSVEARQNAQLNGNQGSGKAENQPLAEIIIFNIYFFPIFFWHYCISLGYITKISPKSSRSKSTLHYKSDQATQKSILDFSWSWLLVHSVNRP